MYAWPSHETHSKAINEKLNTVIFSQAKVFQTTILFFLTREQSLSEVKIRKI